MTTYFSDLDPAYSTIQVNALTAPTGYGAQTHSGAEVSDLFMNRQRRSFDGSPGLNRSTRSISF